MISHPLLKKNWSSDMSRYPSGVILKSNFQSCAKEIQKLQITRYRKGYGPETHATKPHRVASSHEYHFRPQNLPKRCF